MARLVFGKLSTRRFRRRVTNVCWLHKTLNMLDKFPKSVQQPNAHKDLREIWLAPDRATAETAIATFAEKYAPKYDKAIEWLIKDRETLLTFFDFPADHIRGSNSMTKSRSRPKPNPPLDSCRHPKSAIAPASFRGPDLMCMNCIPDNIMSKAMYVNM